MDPSSREPYLVLLRRELIRAQARLRRCERERDALRATLDRLARKKRARSGKKKLTFPNNNS